MKTLYVCDWNPNGTNDILVYEDGEILAYLPEALFGVSVHMDSRIDEQTVLCDDFITCLSPDAEGFESCTLLNSIDPETALQRVAISPVSNGSAVVEFITKHFGGAQ